MPRTSLHIHVIIFSLSTALFVLIVGEAWGGGHCISSLSAPSEGAQPSYMWSMYGWPLTFLTVRTEGCLENRRTRSEWQRGGLLVDLMLFMSLGVVLEGSVWLYRRSQQRVREPNTN